MVYQIKESGKHHGHFNHEIEQVFFESKLALKKKFDQTEDQRIKLNREISFYKFCQKTGCTSVPELLEVNTTEGYITISYIDGEKRDQFANKELDSFSEFLALLNQNKFRDETLQLPDAGECILTSDSLEQAIEIRLAQVGVTGKFHPKGFDQVLNKLLIRLNLQPPDIGVIIANPSDYGLHNYLVKNGKGFFFDFEYAGKDSLLKCIMDFALHPANGLELSNYGMISKRFSQAVGLKNFIIEKNTIACFCAWWILRLLNSISDNSIQIKLNFGLLSNDLMPGFIAERLATIHKFYSFINEIRDN